MAGEEVRTTSGKCNTCSRIYLWKTYRGPALSESYCVAQDCRNNATPLYRAHRNGGLPHGDFTVVDLAARKLRPTQRNAGTVVC